MFSNYFKSSSVNVIIYVNNHTRSHIIRILIFIFCFVLCMGSDGNSFFGNFGQKNMFFIGLGSFVFDPIYYN